MPISTHISGSRIALSVIVPMYREAMRIGPTLKDLVSTLEASGRAAEIILVDDGSTDNTVGVARAIIAARSASARVGMCLLYHRSNRGKGAAVRTGLAAATGDWRLIMDADNSCRVAEVEQLLALTCEGVGMVAGSRAASGARVLAKAHRKAAGLVFQGVLRALGMNLMRDTQCGFKLYRGDVADQVVAHSIEEGFAFDLEHLLITQATGLRVVEAGVQWKHCDGGHVSPLRDGARMVREAMRIRRRWRAIGRPSVEQLPQSLNVPKPRAAVAIEAKPRAAPIVPSVDEPATVIRQ